MESMQTIIFSLWTGSLSKEGI